MNLLLKGAFSLADSPVFTKTTSSFAEKTRFGLCGTFCIFLEEQILLKNLFIYSFFLYKLLLELDAFKNCRQVSVVSSDRMNNDGHRSWYRKSSRPKLRQFVE